MTGQLTIFNENSIQKWQFNLFLPEFYFQREKWIVLLLRTSGIETIFRFTDKWPFYTIVSYIVPFLELCK